MANLSIIKKSPFPFFIVILFLMVAQAVQAQPDSLFLEPKYNTDKIPLTPVWLKENKAVLDFNEVAFVNWNSGGTNSISALLGIQFARNYALRHFTWNNTLRVRYGINAQEDQVLRKTDDHFEIIFNVGYRADTLTNWFYSARFNFRTQLSNGYSYPDTSNPISRFMAPGYVFLGGGIEYGKNIEKLSLYFSPFTLKSTFVLDEKLANAGSFGVKPAVLDDDGNILVPGEKTRLELGILLSGTHETPVMENVVINNSVSLYTDYINNFGNIDVDWVLSAEFKVNQFIRASLGSHLKYDDDVKTFEPSPTEGEELVEKGAKVQWKQLLGVGVVVDF
ncbi:MAG TPA: DUF3078 domain-containing protein [Mangrovimonas sp.]|nr:DUF3078 domain-containing protein [Mangrovimonas sp.]